MDRPHLKLSEQLDSIITPGVDQVTRILLLAAVMRAREMERLIDSQRASLDAIASVMHDDKADQIAAMSFGANIIDLCAGMRRAGL